MITLPRTLCCARAIPLALFIVLLTVSGFAQSGWEHIGANNNRLARQRFLERLKTDSTDADALKGLIYLAELEGDPQSYIRSINTLIRHHWEEPIFVLFRDSYTGSFEDAVTATTLSERVKIDARIRLAREKREERKFAEVNRIYLENFGDYKWSIIGPFKNLSGSGHITVNSVEREPFDPKKTYADDSGLPLMWLTPEHCGYPGGINFTRHLPDRDHTTYYANTFLEAPTAMTVQLRIGRSAPIKIWLDDDLVYENADPVAFDFDGEIVQMDIPAGTHRLMAKVSSIPLSMSRSDEYDLFEFFDSPDFDQDGLTIRVTDTAGTIASQIVSRYTGTYTPGRYNATAQSRHVIRYYQDRIAAEPRNLFNYYALCKAYMTYGFVQEAEEFFVRALRNNPENICLKYLAAKSYATNGKIEAAYDALNGVDVDKTPIYSLLYERFQEIDQDNDEPRYLEALHRLHEIAPSNFHVISLYIDYYTKKDMDEQRDAFIDSMMAAYPTYVEYLEPQKSVHDVENNALADEERKSQVDSLMNRLKSRYDIDDYETVIEYFRDQNEHEKVVGLYDEVIGGSPYSVGYRISKTYQLFESKRFDDALKVMDTVLAIAPNNDDALELVGDIYDQLKDKQKALDYYRRAQKSNARPSLYRSSIQEKIEKIEGPRAYKSMFDTKTFADILNDNSWKQKYAGEESVVLMYTRDMILDTNDQVRSYDRMMIKILSEAGANTWTQTNFGFMGNLDFVKVIKTNGAEIVPDRQGEYVVFKNLVPGDLIQIEGQDLSPTARYFDREYFDLSVLGFDDPVYYAKFEVIVPKGRYLGYLLHRLEDNLVKKEMGPYDSYRWEYRGLSRVQAEDAVIDRMDLYRNIFISTMPDWSRIVDWYSRMTYRKFEPTYDVLEALDSVIDGGMTQEQKMVAIYNYITKEINYSSVPFLQSAYTPKKANLTLSARIGDCKDVATLMIMMLRAAGIEANYTLVKTTNFTHQKILPSIYFNHVVVMCMVDGKRRYLDLVTDFYPHYVMPESDGGAWALLVKDGEKELFQLPHDYLDPEKNESVLDINATLNIDRSINLNVKARCPGVRGGNIRENLYGSSEDEVKNFIVATMGRDVFTDLHLVDWDYQNQFEITEPLNSSYVFSSARFSDKVSNLLIFRLPYMIGIPTTKALLSKTRQNDVNLREIADIEPVTQRVSLTFPKGYALTEFPKDINVESKYGSYSLTFKKQKDGLMVEKRQRFFVSEVPAAEFDKFKEFYLQILDIDASKYAVIKGR